MVNELFVGPKSTLFRIGSLLFSDFLLEIQCKKMKFSVKNFSSKCDHIRRKLRIWSHLLKKSLIENFMSWVVLGFNKVIKVTGPIFLRNSYYAENGINESFGSSNSTLQLSCRFV